MDIGKCLQTTLLNNVLNEAKPQTTSQINEYLAQFILLEGDDHKVILALQLDCEIDTIIPEGIGEL